MTTVIIAAHNEESVLGGCLDALLREAADLEIIVSANGCTDGTVAVARSRGVTVIDRAGSGKAAALNAAEEVASGYPRIYLDADIVVPQGAVGALADALLSRPGALAAVPARRVVTSGRPWPVRGFSAINRRLPVYRKGLFGRGMIAVSEEGRRRFDSFPTMIADDLFIDSQFLDEEKIEVADVETVVETPPTTRALLHRLVRVRRGNSAMRAASHSGEVVGAVRSADRWAWLKDVVLPEPRLVLAAIPYVVITTTAALLARRGRSSHVSWTREGSTRRDTTMEVHSTA